MRGYGTAGPHKGRSSKRYLHAGPFKGERVKRRKAHELIKNRRLTTYGRRPGRMEVIEDKCPGYLDDMSNKKNGGDLRIFFQNIGTLKLGMQTDVSEEAVEIMHGLGVDIAGLTEINKKFGNSVVQGQAVGSFRGIWEVQSSRWRKTRSMW